MFKQNIKNKYLFLEYVVHVIVLSLKGMKGDGGHRKPFNLQLASTEVSIFRDGFQFILCPLSRPITLIAFFNWSYCYISVLKIYPPYYNRFHCLVILFIFISFLLLVIYRVSSLLTAINKALVGNLKYSEHSDLIMSFIIKENSSSYVAFGGCVFLVSSNLEWLLSISLYFCETDTGKVQNSYFVESSQLEFS